MLLVVLQLYIILQWVSLFYAIFGIYSFIVENRIKNEIDNYLGKNPFIKKADILKVVQIIDTDGAFVPGSMVRQSETGKTEYFETHIAAKNKDRLKRRNISKREIVYHLMQASSVAGFSYEIYFFSRNMEHVLHGISEDLSDNEKEELAFEIADQYSDSPIEFLKFLYSDSSHVPGTYQETWKFIMENGNSLKRHCNISLFFEKLGIVLDE